MAIQYDSETMYEKYRLTDEQIKACKAVFRAMRKAGKLGVNFWDMYGNLTAYNGNVFDRFHMEPTPNGILALNSEGEELTYSERLTNFEAGCADDPIWLELKDKFVKDL